MTDMHDRFDGDFENVLLVSIDCLRADWLQKGVEEGLVPTLARLREDGVRFEQTMTVANTTDPSCTSIMTAAYPHTHGVQENGWGLDESVPVLGEALQDAGYDTFGVVSVDHLSDEHSKLGRGFDAYRDGGGSYDTLYPILSRIYDTKTFNRVFGAVKNLGTEKYNVKSLLRDTGLIRLHCRTAKSVTSDAVEELDRVDGPFFGWVHYFDMHEPRNYDRADLDDHDEYTAAMLLVDDYVEQLLDALRDRGLYDDTLVILTADHGEALADHGYTGHGRQLYDEEVHVPLAFHHPDVDPGTVSDQVRTIDLAPTILDLLGVDAPDAFEGWSVLEHREEPTAGDAGGDVAAADGGERPEGTRDSSEPRSGGVERTDGTRPSSEPRSDGGETEATDAPAPPGDRDAYLTAYPEFTESVGLRVPGWKCIREGDGEDATHELYDLDADPGETEDLVAAGETADTPFADLRERLAAWAAEGEGQEGQEVDADTQEMLKDLGYVD